MNIYIAAPVVGVETDLRRQINRVYYYADRKFAPVDSVYLPWQLQIPNAWNMPQSEWARCVFTADVMALDKSDVVVVCDFGRHSSCGTAWEAGYAFAKGKKVVVVQMPGVAEVSLMVHNGCTCVVSFDDFVNENWDWPDYKTVMPETVQN